MNLRPRTTVIQSLAVALIAALGVALAPSPSVQASQAAQAAQDDVTWTVRTASNDYGAERSSFSYTVNPGATVEDALVVTNHGDQALDLDVYAADGYTTDSGQFDLLVAGAESATVGAWTELKSDSITVAPGESVDVPFSLTVPDNATPGDYAGGIVSSLTEEVQENGISVDRRLGIKMSLRVGGELTPSMAIENVNVAWNGGLNPVAGGDATVSYTIHNTGNAVLSAQEAVGVAGPFGVLGVQAPPIDQSPTLLPGESWDVTVEVDNVAAVFWLSATATVTPLVVDAAGSTNALTPVTATAGALAVPWMLLLIVLALAALVYAVLLLRKRERARQRAREDERVQEAVERALETVDAR